LKRKYISIGVILLFVLSVQSIATQTQAHIEEGGDCENPTTSISITAAPSGQDSDVSFSTDELSAPTDTCVKVIFTNKAPSTQHSFVIDSTSDFGGVHIHLMNNTSGFNGNGTEWTNVMTPSSATELTFYCGVTGHKAAGMEGTLIVGSSGDTAPGFTFATALLGVLAAFLAVPIFRKKIRQ